MSLTDLDALAERFWPRVAGFKPDECWPWPGSRGPTGYASFSYRNNGKVVTKRAHRLAYELAYGPIADGLEIDHLCYNRACINPEHLDAVTPLTNTRRAGDRQYEMHEAGQDCGWAVCAYCQHFFREPAGPPPRRTWTKLDCGHRVFFPADEPAPPCRTCARNSRRPAA